MTYSTTATRTTATTATEARVRYVMQKVEANFAGLVVRQLITAATASSWIGDLVYLQIEDAVEFFELQVGKAGGDRYGLRYRVSSDGSLQQDAASGGLDLHGIPSGTPVRLFVHLRLDKRDKVMPTLKARGWGFDGKQLDAAESESRVFSTGGYGLRRSKVGTWP